MGQYLEVAIVPVTAYQQNCSILKCKSSGRAAVVDPGGDLDKIEAALQRLDAKLEKVLLTHGHMDHCAAADVMRQRYEIPIIGPQQEDAFWIDNLPQMCEMTGLPPTEAFTPDQWLEDDARVTVGDQILEVYHCPGHTPGHVVFYHRGDKLAIVGDVLFQGSIGRTDFPKSDHDALIRSIETKLWPLGDEVTFVPGHGPNSTFGQERRSNPFVADARYR